MIGVIVMWLGGGTGDALLTSATKGFDKAIVKLEKAQDLFLQEKQQHDEEIARRMKRCGEVEKAKAKAARVASKLRELTGDDIP